jgi:hypothetical protein
MHGASTSASLGIFCSQQRAKARANARPQGEAHMLTRRAFTAVASVAAMAARGSADAQTAASGRRAEIEALRRFAETTHPRGREAAADTDWRARWDALAANADALRDGAYVHRTRQSLGWFKDGHTSIHVRDHTGQMPAQFAQGVLGLRLPLQIKVFHDGAYVVAAEQEALPLLGAQITRVGSMTTVDLIRAWSRQWPGSDANAHNWARELFAPAFLEALGAVGEANAPVLVEATRRRRRVRATLRPRADGAADLTALPRTKTDAENWLASANGNGNFVREVGNALYVSVDDFGASVAVFGEFTHACFTAMEEPAPQRLILDIRRNGGGNNFLFEALRKRIGRSRFNRPGALYMLISPTTFSAAQNAVNRIERETFALFVGEPSGGAPNHYGDARMFTGEATGMRAFVSSLPWFDSYPQDRREWTMPDLFAPNLFADWQAGRDAALQLALTHVSTAPADEWSEDSTFFFARPSQAVNWRPFWRPATD